MIYFAGSLKHLKQAVDSMIQVMGENAPVGRLCVLGGGKPANYMDDIQLEWVYINGSGDVVGDQANDYVPKEGEKSAVMIS